ncbi:MAG TPA: hypothetical protein VG796_12035 [Verrucomicrobiales bacterium]|nr:hypothetical protein [Verrucomicrobiales bacterium]
MSRHQRAKAAAGKNALTAARVPVYRSVVKDDPGEEHSPYDAPEASLDTGDANGVISAKALRLLVSSKWWMMMASVALMVNGATLVLAVFYMLIAAEAGIPTPMKLLMALVVVAAHLIFLPGLRLMQSALALGRARESREERDMVHALHRHEEFWKLLGVAFLMVGGLIFYGLLFALR